MSRPPRSPNPAEMTRGTTRGRSQRPQPLADGVDAAIRHSQTASDGQPSAGTYWGEPIVFHDVTVGLPRSD